MPSTWTFETRLREAGDLDQPLERCARSRSSCPRCRARGRRSAASSTCSLRRPLARSMASRVASGAEGAEERRLVDEVGDLVDVGDLGHVDQQSSDARHRDAIALRDVARVDRRYGARGPAASARGARRDHVDPVRGTAQEPVQLGGGPEVQERAGACGQDGREQLRLRVRAAVRASRRRGTRGQHPAADPLATALSDRPAARSCAIVTSACCRRADLGGWSRILCLVRTVSWGHPRVSAKRRHGSTPLCTNFVTNLARMRRAALVVVVFLAFAGTARADTLKVGSLTLRSCGSAYCGKLSRPLDPAKPTGRRIDIAFRWYRAPKRPTGPPIVAVEGGPGLSRRPARGWSTAGSSGRCARRAGCCSSTTAGRAARR